MAVDMSVLQRRAVLITDFQLEALWMRPPAAAPHSDGQWEVLSSQRQSHLWLCVCVCVWQTVPVDQLWTLLTPVSAPTSV